MPSEDNDKERGGRTSAKDLAAGLKLMGDFTAGTRLVWLSLLAIPVGLACAVIALALVRLIAFFTNVFYYGRFAVPDELLMPAGSPWGWPIIFVPVVGGLIVGLMARFGSERIRGHGIPEALEAILIGHSQMKPKVAVLKPLSSAVAIGSGGPFGAEGPIIMTGGAIGSLLGQLFNLTAAERKTLLVAGAAGGMSATFGTPVAAVVLAVELLLFEWKPRSLVPVAMASAAAALIRGHLGLDAAPLFEVALHTVTPGVAITLSAIFVGIAAGMLSMFLTGLVYAAEDAFAHIPIHWMWWPAIGGLVVGIGGYFEPRALGVGYDIIADLLSGNFVAQALIGLVLVKCIIWAVALGSGTSGGVLAPLLIMGGILGALESTFLPGDKALWPLVSMAAVMGGAMRSPLTGVLFALELTYDVRLLLPLLVASMVAHGFTVLLMKRSILTEKIVRRGYHISREYSVDPMERLSVGEAMSQSVVCVPATLSVDRLVKDYFLGDAHWNHQGYPVVDEDGELLGVITKSNLLDEWLSLSLDRGPGAPPEFSHIITYDLMVGEPITAYEWESCRVAVERMAQAGVGRMPVVDAGNPGQVVGILTRSDLLKGRARLAREETLRERFFAFGPPQNHDNAAKQLQ